jgi:hypothetical protein
MNAYDAAEQAYKRGYEQGKKDARKKECCDACKELSKVYDGSQELLTAYFINRKNGNPTFLLTQGNWKPESVKIAVNYCPWCGRYLRGEEDGK